MPQPLQMPEGYVPSTQPGVPVMPPPAYNYQEHEPSSGTSYPSMPNYNMGGVIGGNVPPPSQYPSMGGMNYTP